MNLIHKPNSFCNRSIRSEFIRDARVKGQWLGVLYRGTIAPGIMYDLTAMKIIWLEFFGNAQKVDL